MKFAITFLILLFAFSLSFAKSRGHLTHADPIEIFTVSGRIIEQNSQAPIEFATILIKESQTDDLIEGTISDADGLFTIKSPTKDIYIEISFIGYETKTVRDIANEGNLINIGDITLGSDAELMDEVVVKSERSTTEFRLDKRVFNVGSDLSSTGAGALEVLNNVPSVNVNIEGEISLRGSSGVQILINGKPSILASEQGNALGSITADMISHIEVITNPSAKYEAEGTSGIINIVLKKEEKKGVNGSISINTGIPDNHSVGLSLNKRTEKINLFSQLGAGYRELPRDRENINLDKVTRRQINSNGTEFRNEGFYNFILGSDYYINKKNILTLSGSFAYEIEDQPSQTFFTETVDGIGIGEWNRTEVTEANNPKYQYELQYKREFNSDKDHQLLFSAIGNYFGKDQSSVFMNHETFGTSTFDNQKTRTNFEEGKYTFNLDYTRPIDEKWTIEMGSQYLLNDVSNDFEVSNQVAGEFVVDPGLTNVFEYDQKVLGVYATGAFENDVWGIKVGLRAENTDLSTILINTNEINNQNFTNLFPSLHTSYKFTEAISLQAGYSRRIYRPRLWDLNPFFNIRNNFSILAGNPNLLPEYTDSYEIGSIFIFNKTSFNFNIYQRLTTDVIERVSSFENGVNTTLPLNVGKRNAGGAELNFKYSPNKILTINGDFNYYRFSRIGVYEDINFDFSAGQWTGQLTTKFKLNKNLDIELTGQYESEEQTIQGSLADNLYADFGVKYKVMKGRGVFNMSVRDIFASRIRKSITDQNDFYVYSFSQRGRFFAIGFSYGFGKGEAMQYSGRRRR